VHLDANQQTARIGHNVTLPALDLFGRIIAARPTVSVVLTD
jgi:hypothetical protein